MIDLLVVNDPDYGSRVARLASPFDWISSSLLERFLNTCVLA